MKNSFDKPIVTLLGVTPDPLFIMYIGARTCFEPNTFEIIAAGYTEEKAEKLIRNVKKLGHDSIFEHVIFNFYIEQVSRSLMAQLTRHRLCSFLIQSQHYQNYSDFDYKELEEYPSEEIKKQYHLQVELIRGFYKKLIREGVPHKIAREILPNCAGVRLLFTVNARELRHIIKLRITKSNTPEIRVLAQLLLAHAFNKVPVLFEDLIEEHSDL